MLLFWEFWSLVCPVNCLALVHPVVIVMVPRAAVCYPVTFVIPVRAPVVVSWRLRVTVLL